MADLNNKKILLFIPMGRGIYGTGLSNELEKMGTTVSVYDERPSQSFISKFLIRSAKNIATPYLLSYFTKIIFQNKHKNFDYVLIIRGEGLTPKIMKNLRSAYTEAKFILYLWDSLKNTNTLRVFSYFDKILSFDKTDVENHSQIIFRPLFFLPDYEKVANVVEKPIDILFVGTVRSDRYNVAKKLQSLFANLNVSTFFYFYFPSRLLFLKKKLTDPYFRHSKIKDFKFRRLNAGQVAHYMSMSKSSLDIHETSQNGLNMRVIETLGAKRKLITTNESVNSYDFYDKRNVLIIDRENPIIDLDFINTPYYEIPEKIYYKYSLRGWVEDIFS